MIETGGNIAFQYPLRSEPVAQYREALSNGVRRGSLFPKPLGGAVTHNFCDGVESQQVQGLHGSVFHRRHHHSTLPPLTSHLRNG
jgi:hypothetical protein